MSPAEPAPAAVEAPAPLPPAAQAAAEAEAERLADEAAMDAIRAQVERELAERAAAAEAQRLAAAAEQAAAEAQRLADAQAEAARVKAEQDAEPRVPARGTQRASVEMEEAQIDTAEEVIDAKAKMKLKA